MFCQFKECESRIFLNRDSLKKHIFARQLDRSIDEISKFKNKRDKQIHKIYHKDIELNKFIQNSNIINFVRYNDYNAAPYFACGNSNQLDFILATERSSE